ncbi:ankyrin-1-like [Trichogramma pretiosum]|uniref:ankyrin-1-like n=1 Tax=Trichogramma pretiosum TaxID=7493 RepID=UPI000C71B63B|nr:ankyrin-1-like [Trichogramma pretiosum]
MSASNDGSVLTYENRKKLERLQSLRANVNWEIAAERRQFLEEVEPLFEDWDSQVPNLRDFFGPREIDWLLENFVKSSEPKKLIEFVVRSGYVDEPELNEGGRPVLRRTTAIHLAARRVNCHEVIGELFKIYNRFDVNYISLRGDSTHFHLACRFGCEDAVARFLERGQDPNCLVLETGDTPLHVALANLHGEDGKKVVDLLLEKGADPNSTNPHGSTPLHVICQDDRDDYVAVKMLLELSQKHDQFVHLNVLDDSGNAPVHWAVRRGNRGVFSELLRKGTDPNLTDKDGSTPLHLICEKYEDNALFLKPFLKYYNVDVNAQDKRGNTALHYALRSNNYGLVRELLHEYADPNLANDQGLRPLHIICRRTVEEDYLLDTFFRTIKDLPERQRSAMTIEVDAPDNLNRTMLQWAMANGFKRIAETLLRNGADPNLADADGSTPLHRICTSDSDDIDLLEKFFEVCRDIQRTVQVDAVDALGQTPLQRAVATLKPKIIHVLLRNDPYLIEFTFPDTDYFATEFQPHRFNIETDALRVAYRALAVIRQLEDKEYKLDRSSALQIMKLFDKYGLFDESHRAARTDFETCLNEDAKFSNILNAIEIKPKLSLYKLSQLLPKEAIRLTFENYLDLAHSNKLSELSARHRTAYLEYLFQKLSRGFALPYAAIILMEQTSGRMPLECFEMIVDHLMMEDLYNICLLDEI